MNFVYQKDSSVWCTYFSYVHHRRLSLSFLGGATTVTRPASATISLAAAILAVRLAPAPLQRCLSHQIVGVVILRCPLFAPIGRRRVVPTTISNIVSQSRNPYYQILPRQLDLSIVSSLPRRLPHRQYNATARIVPPVHLLGHLIIKLAFVASLTPYHCRAASKVGRHILELPGTLIDGGIAAAAWRGGIIVYQ